jgi:hypothetical protein
MTDEEKQEAPTMRAKNPAWRDKTGAPHVVAQHGRAQPAPHWLPHPTGASMAGLSRRRIWRGSVILSHHSVRRDQKGHAVEIKSKMSYF